MTSKISDSRNPTDISTNKKSDSRKPIDISTKPVSPNSKKVYVAGSIHPQIRVPFREITLTASPNGNGSPAPPESVIVYDTSGPYTDPNKVNRYSQRHGTITR